MGRISDRLRQIAKVAVAKYVSREGDMLVAFPNRRGGATTIVKKNQGSFAIISLKANRIWFQYFLQTAFRDGVKACFQSSLFRRGVGGGNLADPFNLSTSPDQNLSSWFDSLTGDLIKDILTVSKKAGKLKSFDEVDQAKALKILTLRESIPIATIQRYFPELPTDQEGLHEKIGPFEVIFDHENPKEKMLLEDLISRAVKAVGAEGFSQYLYGKIFVVNKLKGRTIADYHRADDTIRLSHKAKGKEDLRTLIHEIGHRIIHKGGVDLSKIRSKYNEAIQGFSLKVEVGTILKDKKDGKTYQYVGIAPSSRKQPYKIKELISEGDKMVLKGDYRVSPFYFTNFEGDFSITSEWFPSAYSKTNAEEWFCEVFSFALTRGDSIYLDFVKQVRK